MTTIVNANRRVLLAEDHPVNQRVAAAMLEHLGFTVDVVADGEQAVLAATQGSYRAIFMDCQIPVLDGYCATAEIRRLEGAFVHTPIIAVSGSTEDSDRTRCLAAGMDDYLTKPLSLQVITDVLAVWARAAADPTIDTDEPRHEIHLDLGDPGLSAQPVLDPEVVMRLVRLGDAVGEDLIGQLAMMFLADADVRVDALRDALDPVAMGDMMRAAHTLSGAAANIGATDLARLCATLATHSAAHDLADADVLVAAVETELARVRSALVTRSLTP